MASPFEQLAALDRLIHEPARLAILSALGACASADFTFLQRLTGLTVGNLSSHLAKLEEAGLIQLEKRFVAKKPNTRIRITPPGRKALEQHWRQLDDLRRDLQAWQPNQP
jgi:DNA-binding MarR family transcriptional regulator